MFYEQDTQPIPVVRLSSYLAETPQQRYHRLKTFSDLTGIRFLFVYLSDEKQRRKALGKQHLSVAFMMYGGRR